VRLAFVVQRYGLEVAGGAELHCRSLAEQLVARHTVEVFTTRALDHDSWSHGYPGGSTFVNGIAVHRFAVAARRSPRRFAALSNVVFKLPHTREEEEDWVRENGPRSPALLEAITAARDRFDLFIFFSYRYYHSYFGLPRLRDKAVLIPTAEEDDAIGLRIFRDFFHLPKAIAYNTPEERSLIEETAGGTGVPGAVVGCGLSLSEAAAAPSARDRFGLKRPFLLYLGRVEPNKGCATLFAYFQKWSDEAGHDLDLVLAGKAAMPVPEHPRIRALGFVTEEEKASLLLASRALVMPSRYESLSLVLLEAWKMGIPVLANARCRVLLGQCRRSNGGLAYDGYREFAGALSLLLQRPDLCEALGRQGRTYVEAEYSWPRVLGALEDLFQKAASQAPPSTAS
jgi:glycosyltransferase involved in cell wall biosynthesis